MTINRTSSNVPALRRLGELLTASAFIAALALGQSVTADAQPKNPGNAFDKDAYITCTEDALNRLYDAKGSGNLTASDLDGVVIDCCYFAHGTPAGSTEGTWSCPDLEAASHGVPPKPVPTQQQPQGTPPVASNPPTVKTGPIKPTTPPSVPQKR